MNGSFQQTSVAAGTAVSAEQNVANAMRAMFPVIESGKTQIGQLGLTISNTVSPMEQMSSASQRLAGAFSAGLAPIVSAQGPLRQLPIAFNQTAASMDKAATSGNRLAELFRGNRGLVFGASALFGTLTGIGFELQLVSDAQDQVSASTAHLNDLVAQGKTGTAEYSQAQQALAKDQRFLEFSTRNLALAFTNLIPDVLLIANGVLNLRDKLTAGKAAQDAMTASTKVAGASNAGYATSLKVVDAEQKATIASAAPLRAMITTTGTASLVTAERVGILSTALNFLKANIRGVLISTGIGALVVGLSLLVEHLISSADAAKQAQTSMASSADKINSSFGSILQAVTAYEAGVRNSSSKAAKDFSESAVQMAGDIDKLAKKFDDIPQRAELAFLKAQKFQMTSEFETAHPGLLEKESQAGKPKPGHHGFFPSPSPEDQAALKAYHDGIANIDARMVELGQTGNQVLDVLAAKNIKASEFSGVFETSIIRMGQTIETLKPKLQTAFDAINQEIMSRFAAQGPQNQSIIAKMLAGGASPQDAVNQVVENFRPSLDAIKEQAMAAFEATLTPEQFQAAKPLIDIFFKSWEDGLGKMTGKTPAAKKAVGDLIDTTRLLIPAENEVMDAMDESNGVREKQIQITNDIVNTLGSQFDILNLTADQYKTVTDLVSQQVDVVKSQEAAIGSVAAQHQILNAEMVNLIINEEDNRTELNLMVAGLIQWDKALTDVDESNRIASEGILSGTLKLEQFTQGLIRNTAEQEIYHNGLLELAAPFTTILPAGIQLTTSELEKLLTAQAETGHSAEVLADIVNSRLAPAFDTFRGVIDAATTKDALKAFKEIDFGGLNKDAVKDIKDMELTFQKVAEQGRQINNVISALIQGVSSGNLKNSTLRQGLDEISDSIERVAKTDPEGKFLLPFSKFLDNLDKGDREAVVAAYGDAIVYLATAMSDGDLRPEEVLAFYDKLNVKFDATNTSASDLSGQLDDLKTRLAAYKDFQQTGDIGDTGEEIDYRTGLDPSNQKKKQELIDNTKTKPEDAAKQVTEQANQIAKGLQTVQTAFKNLAEQGANTMSIMVNNVKAHVTTLNTYFGVTIPVALQKSQTALANLAIQGSNSLATLVKNAKPHVTTLNTYFATTVTTALATATGAFVGLAVSGSNAMATLVKNIKPHITTLNTYFGTTVYGAVLKALTEIITMQEEGSAQMATMVKNFRPHVITLDTYFRKTIPQAVDATISAFEDGGSAANSFAKDLIALAAAAKVAYQQLKRLQSLKGGSGGDGLSSAQHGMHKTLESDTIIYAHAGERVDIQRGTSPTEVKKANGSGGGDTIINLQVTTVNELDGELIGTTVTRKTFRKMSTR